MICRHSTNHRHNLAETPVTVASADELTAKLGTYPRRGAQHRKSTEYKHALVEYFDTDKQEQTNGERS